MKWMNWKHAAAFCLAAACLMLAAPAEAAKRVALVIGNNDYRYVPKLQKAVNDARTMGETLKRLGFTVMVAENQNRQQFSPRSYPIRHAQLVGRVERSQNPLCKLLPEGFRR